MEHPAREEVASLDAYLKAKKYQLREAEFRLQVARANLSNVDRQLKKGMTSAYSRMLGELSVVEAEADRETRAAELKDIENTSGSSDASHGPDQSWRCPGPGGAGCPLFGGTTGHSGTRNRSAPLRDGPHG